MNAPAYVTPYILISTIAIVAVLLVGLRRAIDRAGWNEAERASTWRIASAVLIVWFAAALALAWAEFFRAAGGRLPTLQYGLFVPIVVAALLMWRSQRLQRLIDAVPQGFLVGIQFYRVLGVIFLLLMGEGRLPAVFALPAGSGDVAVGLLAPVVAYAYARGLPGRSGLALAWNLFGLLDLAVAVTTGFLSSPSPLQMLAFDAPNQLVSAFPLVMVPAFAVPLSVILHLASLRKLRSERSHIMLAHGA